MSHKRKPDHAVKLVTIEPKSVLNRSGMGGFTLNPYNGCPVGCAYCFVPHMAHKQTGGRKWGTYVDVKQTAPLLLEQQLGRLRKPTTIFMSTATDPYQPAEERYQITRKMLEVFARYPQHGLFILTKQSLVERDADIIGRLPRAAVGVSLSVMDDDLSLIIEPWAPATSERLALIKRLSERDIATYILWAPAIVPAPMTEEFVVDSVEAMVRSRARALSIDTLNYRSRQPEGFLRRLARERHAPATRAQAQALGKQAQRRGLGHRIEVLEPAHSDQLSFSY